MNNPNQSPSSAEKVAGPLGGSFARQACQYIAFAVGLAGTAAAIAGALPLFFVPRGMEIHPLGSFAWMALGAYLGWIVGIPLCLFGEWSPPRSWLIWSAVGLCLAPLPLGMALAILAQAVTGSVMRD